MPQNNKTSSHHDKEDLAGEHPKGDLGQLIFAVIFLLVWIIDSFIFVTLAFYGVMPVIPLIIGQIVTKIAVSFLDTPWFVWYKNMIKK